MCLAVPGEVVEIKDKTATVSFSGLKRRVNISFLDGVEPGDYVLVHVGFAIQKIDKQIAMETYRLLDEMGVKKEI